MHAIYMCPNDYMLHACSAPSNLNALFCADTILVSTLGLASNTVIAQEIKKDGGEIPWWTRGSLKQ